MSSSDHESDQSLQGEGKSSGRNGKEEMIKHHDPMPSPLPPDEGNFSGGTPPPPLGLPGPPAFGGPPGFLPPFGFPPPPPPGMAGPPMYPPPPPGFPGYPGHYPMQMPPQHQTKDKGGRKSDAGPPLTEEERRQQHAMQFANASAMAMQMEARVRAAEEVKVEPIKTDFHWFVDDVGKKLRKAAEKQVRETTKSDGDLDLFLVNSNLNNRMIKEWEGMTPAARKTYLEKEESDYTRFINDDEVASRHCATLTSRPTSAQQKRRKKQKRTTSGGESAADSSQDDEPKMSASKVTPSGKKGRKS